MSAMLNLLNNSNFVNSLVTFDQLCIIFYELLLTLVLLNPDISCFANSVDQDQLASEEAN